MPEFELLVEKFLRDELTPAELKRFLTEVKDPDNLATLRWIVTKKIQQKAYTGLSEKGMTEQMFRQMLSKADRYTAQENVAASFHPGPEIILLHGPERKIISLRKLAAIVAAVVLVSGVCLQLWLRRDVQKRPLTAQKSSPALKNDVEPGGNRAVLTLSDGSTINLSDADNGILASQGNTKVVKLNNGQLTYQASGAVTKEVLYNTMSTPRGGQYRLSLPDGTQVWLNASSSITYPTAFIGKDRKVTMTGEAYFEVTANAAMPFKVITNTMRVDVCGTHFNVNAYADEGAACTTLLEGAVNVSAGDHPALKVRPGQQAICDAGGRVSLIDNADVEETIAWKQGLFSFNGADLPAIMRQLARWYDLDVHYEGTLSKRHFTGKVFRNLNLSETLKVLELNHIHFRLEGNKVTVMP